MVQFTIVSESFFLENWRSHHCTDTSGEVFVQQRRSTARNWHANWCRKAHEWPFPGSGRFHPQVLRAQLCTEHWLCCDGDTTFSNAASFHMHIPLPANDWLCLTFLWQSHRISHLPEAIASGIYVVPSCVLGVTDNHRYHLFMENPSWASWVKTRNIIFIVTGMKQSKFSLLK